jgi:ABC-type nitrate/sulfonate/bicarbonate transport system substrate-binding protein
MAQHHIRLASGAGPTFGVDDIACAAATHLGLWEEAGLIVDWTPALGGIKAMGKILDGEVDAAYGGLGPVLQLRAQGNPLRIVASMARALAQNLVVQPHIKTTDDLKGASWAIDGIGALSHQMARSIVAELPITDEDIRWRVTGPPPERIADLLSGAADVSLIRVEEALALTSDPGNDLKMLLGFVDLKTLVPVQPHGVLATTNAYETVEPEKLTMLAKGIVAASRLLNSDFNAFLSTYEKYVSVQLAPKEIERIWQQECQSHGFAVDGEMTAQHWTKQLAAFAALNPSLPRLELSDVLASQFVDSIV